MSKRTGSYSRWSKSSQSKKSAGNVHCFLKQGKMTFKELSSFTRSETIALTRLLYCQCMEYDFKVKAETEVREGF